MLKPTRTLTKEIKVDTAQIRNDTELIKQGTSELKLNSEQILNEIARLRSQLPLDVQVHRNLLLERYLDELTSYAKSVSTESCSEKDLHPLALDESCPSEPIIAAEQDQDPLWARDPLNVEPGYGSVPETYVHNVVPDHGHLVMHLPIPSQLALGNSASFAETNEFSHQRYTIITCPPYQFTQRSYTLRHDCFYKPRIIDTLVTIKFSFFDLPSKTVTDQLARTINSIISNITELGDMLPWQNIVVLIVCTGPMISDALCQSMLRSSGLCIQPRFPIQLDSSPHQLDETEKLAGRVVRKRIYARLYEVY